MKRATSNKPKASKIPGPVTTFPAQPPSGAANPPQQTAKQITPFLLDIMRIPENRTHGGLND